jgi:hypothetical protein
VGASIVRGIRGVFVDPLAGARRAGLLGFIKGVATGVAGLAARPISGLLNFSSKAFLSIRDAASRDLVLGRQRPPRFFAPDAVLRAFNVQDALLCAAYRRMLRDGTIAAPPPDERRWRQASSSSAAAVATVEKPILFAQPNENSLFFVTTRRFVFLTRREASDEYAVAWSIDARLVREIPLVHASSSSPSASSTALVSSSSSSSSSSASASLASPSEASTSVSIYYALADDERRQRDPHVIRCASARAAHDLARRLQRCVYSVHVERALFGLPGAWVNVTQRLRARLATPYGAPADDATVWRSTAVRARAFGASASAAGGRGGGEWHVDLCGVDPCPGRKKLLIVDYVARDEPVSLVFRENEPIVL